jgi:hypothetical protein
MRSMRSTAHEAVRSLALGLGGAGTRAGGVENLFKNQSEDQFATRVEIHGTIESKETSAWQAIGAVLHNAFMQAFEPSFERLRERRD